MSLFSGFDITLAIGMAECILIAGMFNLMADQSEEGKLPRGFWTKADTWEWKYRKQGIWRVWPTFDGWHLLKGRMVDFVAMATALPFATNIWKFCGAALLFRCLFSYGNTVHRKA